MKPTLSALILIAISIVFNGQTARAPEVIYKRSAKVFYDRVGPEEQPVRMQKCRTPGTIWFRNACWRPERIPS